MDTRKITILIVDDEEDLRDIIAFDFKRLGFNVLEAENGVKAFELVKGQKIDIVISDIQMAGGDGIELLDQIKFSNPLTPVVMFITGFTKITIDEAYQKGVERIFTKPFDRKELILAVNQSILSSSQRWQNFSPVDDPTTLQLEQSFSGIQQAGHEKSLILGRGGMFIAARPPFPTVSSTIQFRFHFSEGPLRHIQGSGLVRWVRTESIDNLHQGYGIEFLSLHESCLDEVITWIEQQKIISFIPNGKY